MRRFVTHKLLIIEITFLSLHKKGDKVPLALLHYVSLLFLMRNDLPSLS